MKKAIVIVVLGLLLSGNGLFLQNKAFAEIIESSDKHIWIYLPKGTPKKEAFSKRGIQYAKDHCIKHKKNTYSFSEGNSHDYDRLGFGRYQFRFICAKNKNEALENLKTVISNFSKESVYQVKIDYPSINHITLSHIEFKETKIAEEPKKQEPKKVVGKIPDLTNSEWDVIKPKGVKKFLIEFYSGGKCKDSTRFGGSSTNCQWSQNGMNVIFDVRGIFKFKGKISSNNSEISMSGIVESIDHSPMSFSGRPISITNYLVEEKPKKEKPKPSPDDSKVVAAASGSGFFVSNTGHIVTNHHVIDECKAVKVNFKGDEIEAKILAIDKTNDLAILKANINPSKVYSVSNEDVTLLQDIIVAGFPLGKRVSAAIKTHKGSVSALAGFGDNYSNFQTDATINQGNSGGPVMDHKGNIVGVAVALMSAEAGQNIFFAVKSSTLKTFANANGITFLPPNNREMSNAELGQLITEGTLFLECWMTIAKIKQIIAQEENRKAFYSEHK